MVNSVVAPDTTSGDVADGSRPWYMETAPPNAPLKKDKMLGAYMTWATHWCRLFPDIDTLVALLFWLKHTEIQPPPTANVPETTLAFENKKAEFEMNREPVTLTLPALKAASAPPQAEEQSDDIHTAVLLKNTDPTTNSSPDDDATAPPLEARLFEKEQFKI